MVAWHVHRIGRRLKRDLATGMQLLEALLNAYRRDALNQRSMVSTYFIGDDDTLINARMIAAFNELPVHEAWALGNLFLAAAFTSAIQLPPLAGLLAVRAYCSRRLL